MRTQYGVGEIPQATDTGIDRMYLCSVPAAALVRTFDWRRDRRFSSAELADGNSLEPPRLGEL